MNERFTKVANSIWRVLNFPFLALEKKENFSGATARVCMDNLTRKTDYIYQYFRFNKETDIKSHYRESFEQVGIVIQGQPLLEDDFTVKTALMYKEVFPGVKVVVSTWEDVPQDFFVKCEQNDIDVVKTKMPLERGAGNLNCQLISSARGIQYLKEKGVKYVAKTRTDQRFNWCGWIKYLLTLLSVYPVKGDKQNNRIIFMESNGTYKYIAFHVCDFFSFGSIDDIERLYNIPLDCRSNHFFNEHSDDIEQFKGSLLKYECNEYFDSFPYKKYGEELEKWGIAEFYILSSYVHKYIYENLTAEDMLSKYWQYLRDYAVIADSFQMQFYWPKYRRKFELQSKYDKSGKLDFAEWLSLYSSDINFGLNLEVL